MKFNLRSYFTFLSRNKAYTAVNVLGLSVSLTFVILIGLYTWQEFSVDRQHGKADRIYSVGMVVEQDGNEIMRSVGSHHSILRQIQKTFPEVERTCAFVKGSLLLRDGGYNLRVATLETDPTFFTMFDFPLLRGDRATCLDGKGKIVITQRLARRYFGTDDVMGRDIMTVDSMRFRVTGVMADLSNSIVTDGIDALVDFSYTEYDNAASSDKYFPNGNFMGTATFVEVREGCDFTSKTAEVERLLQTFFPEKNGIRFKPTMQRLDNLYFSSANADNNLRFGNLKLVGILFAVGLAILFFSIMNYINLTVAQSGYRAREMAMRRLFGCSKGTVGKTMFFESLTICCMSLAVSVLSACSAAPYAGRLLDADIDVSLLFSPAALLVLAAFVVAVGLLAGMAPAVILSKVEPVEVVRGTFRKQTKMIFSRVFITVQNVITIVLLACALIMSVQMSRLVNAPLGFRTDNLIRLSQGAAFASNDYPVFIDKLRALPCFKGLAASCGTPVEGGMVCSANPKNGKQPMTMQYFVVQPDFFDVYGIKAQPNGRQQGDSLIFLNDAALRMLHIKATDTRMGELFNEFSSWDMPRSVRYGGTFSNFRTRSILEKDLPKAVMVCNDIKAPWHLTIKVEGDPVDAYRQICGVYKSVFHEDLDESVPPYVGEWIAAQFGKDIQTSKIVSLFAFVAIVISLLGLLAMSTYFIQQRAKEIAIRKVFGSTGGQVRRQLVRTFLIHVGIAFVVAVPVVVYFISGWISQYSYRITWWPWIVVAGLIVLLISFAAVAVQSWVAASENPVKNIKQE